VSFASSIRKFVVDTKAEQDMIVRRVLFNATTMILRRSPVDTGRFRANWQYGYGVQPTGTVEDFDTSRDGSQTRDAIVGQITKGVGVHYLVNNLPYAEVIEFGYYPDPVEKGTYVAKGKHKYGIEGPGYVQRSEGGFSKQAPAGVLRITYEELAADLGKVASEVAP
jgi:hypothetical protein